MTEEIDIDDAVEMVDGDDDHVVLDADEFDRLSEQAEMTDELSDSIDELKDRTALLDEVSRGKVEELREADDPQVVERDDYEALREEVDEMKESLASDIADEVEILDADELTENYTFESLREKHDDLDLDEESTEEELSGTPNAKTEDVESVDEELAVADDLDEAKDELGRIGWDDHADLLGDE